MPNLGDIKEIVRDGFFSLFDFKKETGFPPLPTSLFLVDDQETIVFTEYPVWFATNRKPELGTPVSFTNKRDTHITHHGICKVAILKGYKTESSQSGWWGSLIKESNEFPEPLQTVVEEEQNFWDGLKASIKSKPKGKRRILLYIHGYKVTFEDAAQTAGQLGYDLSQQVMVFYSWPSRGTKRGYPADEATITASEGHLAEFLKKLTTKCEAEDVHVIAHSMGNRGLYRAIHEIVQDSKWRDRLRFGQIILAAPDEDKDTFEAKAKIYPTISARTTLYTCNKDFALLLSKKFHQHHRAGLHPPVTVIPEIDTVDVSHADTSFLGHSSYATSDKVLSDIHKLIHENASPADRFHLDEVLHPDGNGSYWVMRP